MKYLMPLALVLSSCGGVDPHSEEAHGRKVMGLQEKFDRFDYNADGKLTKAEAEQGIRESGVTGVTEAELDAMMTYYDVNKDNAISRWEAERAIDMPVPEYSE